MKLHSSGIGCSSHHQSPTPESPDSESCHPRTQWMCGLKQWISSSCPKIQRTHDPIHTQPATVHIGFTTICSVLYPNVRWHQKHAYWTTVFCMLCFLARIAPSVSSLGCGLDAWEIGVHTLETVHGLHKMCYSSNSTDLYSGAGFISQIGHWLLWGSL